jgi:peptide deformylase
MTVRSVLRMGEPLLLAVADEVTAFDTLELHALIQDMEDTMAALDGAGLAAPQIGVSLRVVIFGQEEEDRSENPRYPDANSVPYTVLINPKLTFLGHEQESGLESCLSVPGLRGIVPRYTHLHYSGFDQYGKSVERTVSDFHARVVQHECDHLDGILYPMRMTDLTTFGYTDDIFPDQPLP